MKVAYLILILGVLFAAACSSTRSRGGGGPVFDGSTAADASIEDRNRADGSIIVKRDPDGSLGQPDATFNPPDATVSTPDATVADNRTRECGMFGPSLRSVWNEPRCEPDTEACIANCSGDTQEQLVACAENCVAADGTPPRTQSGLTIDCGFCLTYELYRCYYSNGCDVQMADFGCCLEDKCSGLTGTAQQSCAESMCATEGQAQNTCFQARSTTCANAADTCYP